MLLSDEEIKRRFVMTKVEFKKRLVELGYNLSAIDINVAFSAYNALKEG